MNFQGVHKSLYAFENAIIKLIELTLSKNFFLFLNLILNFNYSIIILKFINEYKINVNIKIIIIQVLELFHIVLILMK